jgi:hypothetical protein
LESPVVRAALVVPEDPVAPENPVALERPIVRAAARAQQIVPVAAELQHVPVVGVPVIGHPGAQLAAPVGTRSAIEPHRRGRAPVPVAEDSAAVAETTRGPAAIEAAVAWAAAE